MITSFQEYNKRAEQIKDQIRQDNVKDIAHPKHKDYLFTSANWQHFFGQDSVESTDSFYSNYVLQKKLTELDFETDLDWLMSNFELKGDLSFIEKIKSQPYIFASFHFGPYQMQGLVLSEILKTQYAILANSALFMDQFTQFLSTKYNDPEKKGKGIMISKDDVVNPESLNALMKMREKVNAGKSLLVYLDGMEGLTGYLDRDKMMEVNFCGKKMFVRKGIARIAHFLKTPIISLVTRRLPNGKAEVTFAPPVDPAATPKWQDFTQKFMQGSYDFFEPFFLQNPEQFEVFDHLHMYVYEESPKFKTPNTEMPETAEFLSFNEKRFGIFEEKQTFYLFDKVTYGLFKISEAMARFLSDFGQQNFSDIKKAMKPGLFSDLYKKSILVS